MGEEQKEKTQLLGHSHVTRSQDDQEEKEKAGWLGGCGWLQEIIIPDARLGEN